jgi:hypothetical protein
MKLLRSLALVLLATPAAAEGPDLCTLALQLDARIVAITGDPPATECPAIGTALPAGDGLRSQAGAFDPVTFRIDLAPDLDLSTAWGQSFLVHELVHFAQARGGRLDRCEGVLEAEAYSLQAGFLRRTGALREARIITAMSAMLGTCT